MNEVTTIHKFGTHEHSRLTLAADLIGHRARANCQVIEAIKPDSDKKWTTIAINNPDGSQTQILSENTWLAITKGTSHDMNEAINQTVTVIQNKYMPVKYAENYALVSEIAGIFRKIPDMAKWQLAYGVIKNNQFVNLDRQAAPNEGPQAVALVHENGTVKYQSIQGDSMAAVLYDIGRLVSHVIF